MLSLVRSTDPGKEPVKEEEAVLWRASADGDMDWFAKHIPLIRDEFERTLGRALVQSTWVFTLDKEDLSHGDNSLRNEILLPMCPLVSVTQITYTDADGTTAVWSNDNYDAVTGEHGRIALKEGCTWPAPTAGLRRYACLAITFVAGYGTSVATVPGALQVGLRELITFWYANRGEGYVIGRPASPEGGPDVRPVPRAVERVYARLRSYQNLAAL